MGELLTFTVELIDLYGQCATQHKNLADWANAKD
jgi:hypothetical protein